MSAARQAQPYRHNTFDMRRALYNADNGLSAIACALLAYLDYRADKDTGRCHPKVETIAKETRHSERTVYRYLGELEAAGYIERLEKRGRSRYEHNTYQLHVSPLDVKRADGPPPLHVLLGEDAKPGVTVSHVRGDCESYNLPIELKQPEEEERNTDSGPESSEAKPRAQVLELPPRMPPAFVSSASPHLISEHGVAQPPPQQPVSPVSVVVDGGVGGSNAEPVEQREAEDTPPTSATEHTPVHRLPVWLEGATRLDEGKRATKSEVIAVVKRAQWDSTALNLALLWCYVPPGVLSWAVELAEDDAAELPRDDVRRIGILRRKFRYKIRDWATGEDGPVHGRRKLDEGRTGSRHNVSPGVVGVDYSAKYRRAQKTPDALEGVVSKGGES